MTSTCAIPSTCATTPKKAVEELATQCVMTYCLTLDPNADDYVSRLLGPRGYMVVDHVNRLPERLPMLNAGLTR